MDPKVSVTDQAYVYATNNPVNNTDANGDNSASTTPTEECGGSAPPNKQIRTYKMLKVTRLGYRVAALTCTGYGHLKKHVGEFTITWTYFTQFIGQTLAAPTKITPQGPDKNAGNPTRFRYERHIVQDLTIAAQWNGTFVVARYAYTANIITAYPTKDDWRTVPQTTPPATLFSDRFPRTGSYCGLGLIETKPIQLA